MTSNDKRVRHEHGWIVRQTCGPRAFGAFVCTEHTYSDTFGLRGASSGISSGNSSLISFKTRALARPLASNVCAMCARCLCSPLAEALERLSAADICSRLRWWRRWRRRWKAKNTNERTLWNRQTHTCTRLTKINMIKIALQYCARAAHRVRWDGWCVVGRAASFTRTRTEYEEKSHGCVNTWHTQTVYEHYTFCVRVCLIM